MQQRRLRLGDVLDDYCPRERRITNHVVVAMIDDQVKQTRCTTCDVDHDFKNAKVPPPRRKKSDAVLTDSSEGALRPRPSDDTSPEQDEVLDATAPPADEMPVADASEAAEEPAAAPAGDDDGPVHRRLIRATLPRPEGQMPERKEPEFTIRQPGGRGRDFGKNGLRHGRRGMRHGSGQGPRHSGGQPPRHGSGQGPHGGSGHGRPGGHRQGQPGVPRGNKPPGQGPGRGGRKRGR